MSDILNATCKLCGKKYHRCDDCDKLNRVFTSWKMLTETPEHYKAFILLRSYGLKEISEEDTIKQLKDIDLSDLDSWTNETNKVLVKKLLNKDTDSKMKFKHNK